MELVTTRTSEGLRAGRIDGDGIVLLDASDVGDILRNNALDTAANATGPTIERSAARLAPAVTKPGKIVCVGVNYMDHIEEMGRTPPGHPTYFAKFAPALIGAREDIWLPDPSLSTHNDWEGELCVIVGSTLRHATAVQASAGIAGCCVGNDFSVRDFQRRTSQFLGGKTFEHASPLGPALVTMDQVGDVNDLDLSTAVNGVIKQSSNTRHLVFDPIDILVDLSRIVTLEPGDVIFTGTPGGVGAARTPPEWLAPGDVVTTEIAGLGTLENTCVIGPA